jgi:hypothetical protein
LDSLGFPWILSWESRLFNELSGRKRERFFRGALTLSGEAKERECGLGVRNPRIVHEGELILFSNFPQLISLPTPFSLAAESMQKRLVFLIGSLDKLYGASVAITLA